MAVTLKELEAFYWTAVLHSFSYAATHLCITQSTLSKRVAELEDSVRADLFIRSSKRVVLTDAGRKLLPIAKEMLDLAASFQSEVETASSLNLAGECKFGMSEYAALTWLPTMVQKIKEQHPMLNLQPHISLASELERDLIQGNIDFTVSPCLTNRDELERKRVANIDFRWVAAYTSVTPKSILLHDDFIRMQIIELPDASGKGGGLESAATEEKTLGQGSIVCDSLMGIVGMTLAGIGISYLPVSLVSPWVNRNSLKFVPTEYRSHPVGYCYTYRKGDSRKIISIMQAYVTQSIECAGLSSSPMFA